MNHAYLSLLPRHLRRWAHRSAGALGLLLATASAAQAQIPDATFRPVVSYSTGPSGSGPLSLAVADVNGDGKPDLLTANGITSTVGVLLGNGNATFQPVTTYSTGANSSPSSLAVADVNGDSKLDLLVNGIGTAGVLLGNGNGTFQPVTTYSTGPFTNSQDIAVADVNGDGKPDLLVAINNSSTAGVLLGNGDGTFQPITTYSTGPGSNPFGLAVADVNGDGKPDLLTANNGSSTAGVLLGGGNGTFLVTAPVSTGTNSSPADIAVADVNGDGKPDLLTANDGSSTAGVLLGNGNGTFQPVTTYSTGPSSRPSGIAVADVNVDGKPDLLTANYASSTAGVLLGNGNGTFRPGYTLSTGPNSEPRGLAVADVNGDGRPDLLTANFNTSTAGVLVNTTSNALTPPTTVADAYTTPVGVTLTGNVLNNDIGTDPVAILIIRPTHGPLALNPDGTFTYQPAAGYTGPDSFSYYACNQGVPLVCGDPVTVTINVVRVAPLTVADAYSTPQGVTLTGNVLSNDIGTNPQAILIIRPTHGTLLLNPTGTFTYQPAAGYAGSDSFIYYACNMGTPLVCGDPATVSITVTPAVPSLTAAKPTTPNSRGTAATDGPAAAQELALTGSPNPFHEELRLRFALPTAQAYSLAVYDAQGRLVQQLASGQTEAGQAQQLTVSTQTYAAGLYLVRLTTATGSQLLKLVKP